ncbi:protein of unknown function DUF820 [Halothece sp. PCC 7418]|uniref:Uma2 family endonuclease n=1 Tax=Halothece sp. (strain PCC 7418) TaxID=65093 RepID=UPI0002A069F3|nr:Uma2 family endonuclease [Halothece sp. PCC 7418]AFZ45541.1 protein of unknown function DUF820 [Halothece sp. PCC 7418]
MVTSPQSTYLSPEDYLNQEEKSQVKHEYINGKIYPMAGATDTHVTIALNVASALKSQLRGSQCRVYLSDMKLQIPSLKRFYYPDILVTCNPNDRDTSLYKQFPCLIVEVLSDSTEAFDRGDKFIDYQTIETLKEYLLISTKQKRIDYFQRTSEGNWLLKFYRSDDESLNLQTINSQISVSTTYEDVNFS